MVEKSWTGAISYPVYDSMISIILLVSVLRMLTILADVAILTFGFQHKCRNWQSNIAYEWQWWKCQGSWNQPPMWAEQSWHHQCTPACGSVHWSALTVISTVLSPVCYWCTLLRIFVWLFDSWLLQYCKIKWYFIFIYSGPRWNSYYFRWMSWISWSLVDKLTDCQILLRW